MKPETYKTTATGSIDYAHYVQKSHAIRSADAHAALARIWTALASVLTAWRRVAPVPQVETGKPHDRAEYRALAA